MKRVRILGVSLLVVALGAGAIAVAPRLYAQVVRPPDRALLPPPPFGAGGEIGVSIRDVQADDVRRLKLSTETGALIEDVRPGSPASTAGLRENDVIVEFDGEKVRSARQLTRLVLETPPGRHVKVGVMRDGRHTDMDVTPAEAPRGFAFEREDVRRALEGIGRLGRDMAQDFRLPPDVRMMMRPSRLGVNVLELSPDLASYFGVKDGVLVSTVVNDSPAAKAGLKAGDVITAVDGRSVRRAGELVRELDAKGDGREMTLTVTRDKKELTLKARLEGASGRPRTAGRVRA